MLYLTQYDDDDLEYFIRPRHTGRDWWANLKPGKPLSYSRCYQFVPAPSLMRPVLRGVGGQLWKLAWDLLDCSCVLAFPPYHISVGLSAVAPLFTSWFLSDKWLCSAHRSDPTPRQVAGTSLESGLRSENLTFHPLLQLFGGKMRAASIWHDTCRTKSASSILQKRERMFSHNLSSWPLFTRLLQLLYCLVKVISLVSAAFPCSMSFAPFLPVSASFTRFSRTSVIPSSYVLPPSSPRPPHTAATMELIVLLVSSES